MTSLKRVPDFIGCISSQALRKYGMTVLVSWAALLAVGTLAVLIMHG